MTNILKQTFYAPDLLELGLESMHSGASFGQCPDSRTEEIKYLSHTRRRKDKDICA